MVARISDPDERLTGVELTYLEPGGRLAAGLRLVRKTVGLVPPGSAVRLFPVAEEMLVGEGVITTLSAVERFSLPGWALMAAHNLAAWTPPREVRRVLIAADRGRVGEGATVRLRQRLITQGLCAEVSWPGPPFGDWNEAAIVAASRRKEGGR
jgi:putative DNA primase/helicase